LAFQEGGGYYSIVRHVEPFPTTTVAIDATPRLPEVTDLAATSGGASWTLGAGSADGIMVALEVPGEKGTTALEWRVFVAPDQDHVVYPRLPGAPPFANPARLLVSEVDLVDGYAGFRRRAAQNEWLSSAPAPVPAAYTQHLRFVAPVPIMGE
jgi:hypothetical protein